MTGAQFGLVVAVGLPVAVVLVMIFWPSAYDDPPAADDRREGRRAAPPPDRRREPRPPR